MVEISIATATLITLAAVVWWLAPCRVWPTAALKVLNQTPLIRRRLWVVFDNNAYQSLSDDRFAALYKCELRRGVSALASYWVAIELLSHVAHPGDSDFRPAWAAIRRLWRHCAADGRSITWLADSENHACHTLFGEQIPNRQAEAASYGRLLGTIANAQDPTEWQDLQPALEFLADHVVKIEHQFRDDMWHYVVLAVDPNAGAWRPLDLKSPLRRRLLQVFRSDRGRDLSARMIVRKAAANLGKSLSAAELAEKAGLVQEAFPIAVEFYNAVLTRVVETGLDLDEPSNRNAIWDLQIAFSASPAAQLQHCPVWLVTSDRLLRHAARSAGSARVTRSLNDYARLLHGPVSKFRIELSTNAIS